jgi:prolyl oligopeptidase
VAIDLSSPDVRTVVVPESEAPIETANHVGGDVIVERLRDVASEVTVYDTDFDPVRTVDLPGIGSANGFGGRPEDAVTYYGFTSFDRPTTLYRHEVATGETTVFRQPELAFDPEDYVVEQVFFESTGGVSVPMFVVHRRDVTPTLNAPHPTVLYGYGGFAIPLTPSFSVSRLAWMELGGVIAVANLRGGAEYGRAWHDAGRLANKQNVFDDFANAAEHLIDAGWASPSTLAIQGGSNGGLLVGAVANQRPELFAAALPAVGVMDMLRFDEFTAGRFWVDDYGDPDDPEMFDVLRAYSPLHNLPDTDAYPATLVTTADTDDRVVPGHSFKFAAALQAADTGPAPTLIRIETRAGHGAGTPISKIVQETADEWAFAAHHTGMAIPAEP